MKKEANRKKGRIPRLASVGVGDSLLHMPETGLTLAFHPEFLPMDTLADIIIAKRADPHSNADYVRDAAKWLRRELDAIGQKYFFTDMALDYFGYADFSIHCFWGGQRITLEL